MAQSDQQPDQAVSSEVTSAAAAPAPATPAQQILSSWIAADPLSLELLEKAKRVAASASTVLIRGESGVGKELLASLIHYLGAGRDEPLVKIDCASLPRELMESELFGYERGAFTGATQTKRGRLELAGAGTLVLDEIAALTPAMQAKLLRVLEEKRFERLGGNRPVTLAARIIALTNSELEQAVAAGAFRQDLFYRLNVIPLVVPPLRERRGDIRPLIGHFIPRLAELHRRSAPQVSPAALALLQAYDYPGNVRELRNLLERVLVQSQSPQIHPADLPQLPAGSPTMTLKERERAYIAEVLDATRGKKGRAAEILGISRKTLLEKRKRYRLDDGGENG
ncbi:MAG TPA: sigma-54 dependent transcriptional regulator [Terriglobales bacterium]|nr:sigma-54 dependent transcriptional regulator [Terriglobales bacterium]